MRILKDNVILRLLNAYMVDSPQPANISYLWNFGSLLGICLVLQILTGCFLAMHYTAHVDFAFDSVEHSLCWWFSFRGYHSQYPLASTKMLFSNPKLLDTKKNELSDSDFFEWLRGFTDGEGSFGIRIKGTTCNFTYAFYLHKDDANLLNFIKKRLKISSNVWTGDHFCSLTVSSKDDIIKLIKIFDKYPLNTSKHLNYLNFKKGFEFYNKYREKESLLIQNIDKLLEIKKIQQLKDSMNKKRNNFELPTSHEIKITPYWLLGFIEGEGYFSIAKNRLFRSEFGVSQTLSEKKVLEAIQIFLLKLPGEYSLKYERSKPVQFFQQTKPKNENSNCMVSVRSNLSEYILKVLIPFLDSLTWLSKKELDYLDWKIVLSLKQKGWHLTEEGKKIITSICNRMNSNRFSTNLKIKDIDEYLDNKISSLLSQPSNLEVHSNGKIFIKSMGVYLKGHLPPSKKIEVFDEQGQLVNTFESIKSCSIFFNVSERVIISRADSGNNFFYNNKNYTVKRVFPLIS